MSLDKIGGKQAQRFEKLLTKADANQDGKLSREELAGVKKADDTPVFKEARLDKLFANRDKDQDGLLTAEEFKSRGLHLGHDKGHKRAGRHHGFENCASGDCPPAGAPVTEPTATPQTFFDRLLAKLDLNGDGNITADEIQTVKDQFEAQKAAAAEALADAVAPTTDPTTSTTTDTITTA